MWRRAGWEGEADGLRGDGVGMVGRLQRVEGRVFDSMQRLHSPTNAPGMFNDGAVGGLGGSERGNRH